MNKFLTILLCLMAIPLFAIQVSGTQSGTWTADNNPYEVMGDITVPTGQSLTLEPGVEVLITGAYQITVQGLIAVNGTVTDSVRIQPIPTFTGFWDGIRLEWEGTGSF
ncbi:MAG: hypothetical protein JXR56_00450, partial [Candidatus Cloacimonetes bacterium]|nr:hypothetical protein [Candidatus Cloacimonadota bacterium]